MTRHSVTLPSYIFWPITYLATLAVSVGVLWWFILIGGNPFLFRDIVAIDTRGEAATEFRAGSLIGVRRQICSDVAVRVHVFPELHNINGLAFPLPSSILSVPKGCTSLVYGFLMPNLPDGHYTFASIARFQNNLVGRDEYTSFPPVAIEVTP